MSMKKAAARTAGNIVDTGKRKYLSQSDVPAYGLEEALRIATAIADSYGKNPTKPLRVAQAMNMMPSSSTFRMLCGASIAYGLTEGGYNSEQISLSPLGRRIVAPTTEGDDAAARREAVLRPRVVRDFLTRYNESKLPASQIGRNVLEEIGVPSDRTQQVFDLIVESARRVGFLTEVKGQLYVDLDGRAPSGRESGRLASSAPPPSPDEADDEPQEPTAAAVSVTSTSSPVAHRGANRVFITHGKNLEIVGQLKDLLTFGGFTPVVALDNETAAKPVPDKVMDDMRSCGAAIIHVGSERRVLDDEGKEHGLLNQNVLIEIGAALALYGRKFILLVENGAKLPSNLQGLYEVRFDGNRLDYDATMKLLKAFNDFRS